MSFIQNFYTSRDNKTDGNTYVGQEGRLWYNPNTNSIYVNTANVVGGTPVALATGANIVANNITVNTITSTGGNIGVTGNLVISGNISPATETKVGGIKAGPGANISLDGTLTIDTAGLPLSFGDFTANGGLLTLVNTNEDMTLQTFGNAEIQLVGNVGFYKPDGYPVNVSNRYAQFNQDGQVTFYVPDADPVIGAFKIIGSRSGNFSAPQNTGVMLQITGQNNDASRLYNDSIGSFAAFVGRRINGNVTVPTAVVAGDEIIRISSTGYDGVEIPGSGTARIVYQAIENYTPTAKGSNLSLWTTAIGSNVLTKIATIDNANGVNATKFTTSGTVSATGNITGGNILTGGLISATGNITTPASFSGNVVGRITNPVRDAGAQGGGTLTLDFTSDSVVRATYDTTTFTVAFSNYIAGRKVTLILNNIAGAGRTFTTGVAANRATNNDTNPSIAAGRLMVIDYYSVGTDVGNVFAAVHYN